MAVGRLTFVLGRRKQCGPQQFFHKKLCCWNQYLPAEQSLEVLASTKEPVDLIVSDVVIPTLDGTSLIRQVREQNPMMKVIFISGYAEDDFREEIEREDRIHFLSKPFSLEQLASKVKDVLA